MGEEGEFSSREALSKCRPIVSCPVHLPLSSFQPFPVLLLRLLVEKLIGIAVLHPIQKLVKVVQSEVHGMIEDRSGEVEELMRDL